MKGFLNFGAILVINLTGKMRSLLSLKIKHYELRDSEESLFYV
jgi:hypothetical protein